MKNILIKNNATSYRYWNKTKYFLENTFEGSRGVLVNKNIIWIITQCSTCHCCCHRRGFYTDHI